MTRSIFSLLLLMFTLLLACGDDGGSKSKGDDSSDDETSDDSANADDDDDNVSTMKDASARDAGKGSMDAGRRDAGDMSTHPPDAGHSDAASVDASTVLDAATMDARILDASSVDGGTDAATDAKAPNTKPGFMNLAPQLGSALDPDASTPLTPAPPTGWKWYEIQGAVCRDGSQNGIYVKFTASDKLLVFIEGGGACSSPGFCDYNPASVSQRIGSFLGDDGERGATLLNSSLENVRQQPGAEGIFAPSNAANPFNGWNMVYIPYCTGDVHFGTRTNVTVTGVAQPQQFVGHLNMQKFVARIVPTFRDKVDRVVLAGSSAGGFGVLLNFSMVQDAFGEVPVVALDDSSVPFPDKSLPVCLQNRWRELWGFNDAFPPDCMGCFNADGGGLINLAGYLQSKHPNFSAAVISSTEDEVIRAFYSSGLNDCANFENASPIDAAFGETFPADEYRQALLDVRMLFQVTGKFASYYMGADSVKTFHQHLWRPRFYEAAAGSTAMATWTSSFLRGEMQQVGP